MADSAIRASYIHAVKRWGRGWSAGAGEGEWGCGVWEVLIHTRTRGGGQYATHEIEGKPASCVFTVQQTCNFGSCDERRHRQAWRFSRALCTRPRFRFGQDCPTQLSLSTVCPYLALFLFRNRRQLHQSTPLDVCEPCSAAGDIDREGDLVGNGKLGAPGVLPGPKESKGNFRQHPARQHACKVYEGNRDRRKNLQTRGDCGGCCRQWLCAQTARPPSLVMHEAIALG